jgi:protein gp37
VEDARVVGRIDELRAIPAAIWFISAEPLIGPLFELNLTGINWLISRGESGKNARFCDPAWVRSLQAQYKAASVVFFHEQHGENPANFETGDPGIVRSGKKGGHLIDGRAFQNFP